MRLGIKSIEASTFDHYLIHKTLDPSSCRRWTHRRANPCISLCVYQENTLNLRWGWFAHLCKCSNISRSFSHVREDRLTAGLMKHLRGCGCCVRLLCWRDSWAWRWSWSSYAHTLICDRELGVITQWIRSCIQVLRMSFLWWLSPLGTILPPSGECLFTTNLTSRLLISVILRIVPLQLGWRHESTNMLVFMTVLLMYHYRSSEIKFEKMKFVEKTLIVQENNAAATCAVTARINTCGCVVTSLVVCNVTNVVGVLVALRIGWQGQSFWRSSE